MGGIFVDFTFVIKHTSGKSNKVVDALSGVNLILQEIKVGSLGFEILINLYNEDWILRMYMQPMRI